MRRIIVVLTLAAIAVVAVPAPAYAAAGDCWDDQAECYGNQVIRPLTKRNFFGCQVEFLTCYMRMVSGS